MLLIKTFLKLSEKADKKSLCDLIVKWNQESPVKERRIEGLDWQKPLDERMGTEDNYMVFRDSPMEGSISCRYVNVEQDIRWTTEITAYAGDKIDAGKGLLLKCEGEAAKTYADVDRLQRTDPPYILKMLCDEGFVTDDHGMETTGRVIYDADCIETLAGIIKGEKEYSLPVVYVSNDSHGKYPVDVKKLASLLAGCAHVVVQENARSVRKVKELAGDRFVPFNGYAAIYIPEETKTRCFSKPSPDELGEKRMWGAITKTIFRYGCAIPERDEFGFIGFKLLKTVSVLGTERDNHAATRASFQASVLAGKDLTEQLTLIKEKLKDTEKQLEEVKAEEKKTRREAAKAQKEEVAKAKKEITDGLSGEYKKKLETMKKKHEEELERLKKEADERYEQAVSRAAEALADSTEKNKSTQEAEDLIAMFDAEQKEQQKLIESLKTENEKLKNINKAVMNGTAEKQSGTALLNYGVEKEVFPGEIKDLVIGAIEKAITESFPGSRRDDILTDISDANGGYKNFSKEKRDAVWKILKGSKSMTPQQVAQLENEGFAVEKDKRHYKLYWGGDKRYSVTLAATPSDPTAYEHASSEIGRQIF